MVCEETRIVLKVIKFFRGYLYVHLTGYSPERFFNLCGNAGIVLWDIEPEDDGYHFWISLQAFRRLRPMLRKSGTRIRIEKRVGLPFLRFRYRHHRFFLVGLVALFVVLFSMSRFIWMVDVSGNSRYSTQVLTDYLQQEGVGYGTPKSSIDCEETELLLRDHFPDIIWVSVRMAGTRLYLEVQEQLLGAEAKQDETLTDATDLLADVSGIVDSIVVRRGTPLVQKGDAVEEGTPLVSGILELQDDSGETAAYEYCNADADVYIRTTIPFETAFPLEKTVYQKTGNCRFGMVFVFGNRQISFFDRQTKGFLVRSSYQYPRIGKDFYLPLQVILREKESYTVEKVSYSKAEIKALAEEKLTDYCKKLEEKGIQISGKSGMIRATETEISVQGSLEAVVKATRRTETEKMMRQEGTGTYGIDTTDVGHSD